MSKEEQKECYQKIGEMIDRDCDEQCIEEHRRQPVFLEAFSTVFEKKGLPPLKILKNDIMVNVSGVMYKSYRIIRKILKFPIDALIEYKNGRILNGIKGEIDNFAYTFYSSQPTREFYIEYIEGFNLQHFLLKNISEHDVLLVYLQIYLALFIAYTRYGYVHNDLHHENIIIRDLGSEQIVKYPIRVWNETYRIRTRYFPTIIDYGMSQIYEGTKIKMTDSVERYDLNDEYCIPVRDIFKSASTPNGNIYLNKFFKNNFKLFDKVMSIGKHFDFYIIPSIKSKKWGKKLNETNKQNFYMITYSQMIDLFQQHLRDYIDRDDCVMEDFAYCVPNFFKHYSEDDSNEDNKEENKEDKKYVEAYLSLFYDNDKVGKGDKNKFKKGFLSENDSKTESVKISNQLETFVKKGDLTLDDISKILDLQEKACMIRLEHRREIRKIFMLQLKPLIEKLEVKLIKP